MGTLIAQTWDDELAEEVGKAVAEELKLFQVTLWLAPGMNIHRNKHTVWLNSWDSAEEEESEAAAFPFRQETKVCPSM